MKIIIRKKSYTFQYMLKHHTIGLANTMELRHLRYFIAVAEEENFSRAAVRLNISQPPLSQQIKSLEDAIGTPLFRRLSHGVVLTSAGKAFLHEAYQTLASAQKAIETAQEAARGMIGEMRLGLTSSAIFNPLVTSHIREFQRFSPKVRLHLTESNTIDLLDALTGGSLDAVYIRPGIAPPEKVDLYRMPDEKMKVVVPATHPLAQCTSVQLKALSDESFIFLPAAAGLTLYDDILHSCRNVGFEPVRGQIAPQISSVVNLVAAEMGISLVPASAAQIKVFNVHYLDITGPAPIARLGLATKQKNLTEVTQNYLRIIQ